MRRFRGLTVMMVMAGLLAVANTGSVLAQGALTFESMPPLAPGNGNAGVMFNIEAHSIPLKIHRLAATWSVTGTVNVEVWYRPGGFASVYPATAATDVYDTGWVQVGTIAVTPIAANTVHQIPLDLNVQIPANTVMGFAITSPSLRYANTPTTPNPYNLSNQDLTLQLSGGAGGASTTLTPPMTRQNFFDRSWTGAVWYDYDQIQGTHTSLDSVAVNSGSGGQMMVGNNTVSASVRNLGTVALDNQSIVAEYSVNGGTTWSAPQSFSFPSFPTLTHQTLTFTAPASIAAVGTVELQVRLVAPTPIGQGEALKSRTYQPDLDVATVVVTPTPPELNVPMTVQATLVNNSEWNLNGAMIPLRYSFDAGQNFTTQSFLATTLADQDDTQSFTFTQTFAMTVAGNYDVAVSIFPQVSGDPDPVDQASASLMNVGLLSFDYGSGTASSTLSPPVYRGTSLTAVGNYSVYQMLYTADMLSGMPSGVAMKNIGFYKVNDTRTVTGQSHPLRVWLSNTNDSALVGAETVGTFAANAGTMVYENLNYVFPADTGWVFFGGFNGPTPFVYDGAGMLVTVEWVSTGPTSTTGATGSFEWQFDTVPLSPSTGRGVQSTAAAGPTPTTSVALNGLSSSVRKPHARFVYGPAANIDLDIESVSFGAGQSNGPGIGSNSINVTVQNRGSQAITGNFNLIYSTDGGTTWTTPQSVTASGLGMFSDTQTVTLTTPWSIAAVGSQELRVQIDPPIAGDPDLVDMVVGNYTPNADLLQIGGTAPNSGLVVGNNTLTATIVNSGNFSLEGVTIPLQYSVDGGTTWLPSTPHPFVGGPLLANTSGEQTFQFPGTVFFPAGGMVLSMRINPVLTDDPDLEDIMNRTFVVGAVEAEILAAAPLGTTTSVGMPFNLNSYPVSRTQAVYYASELTAAGMSGGDLILGMSIMTGSGVVALTSDYQDVRIGMMHTTDTVLSATVPCPLVSDFTNVFGPSTFAAAEITPTTYIDMLFHTAFAWNGVDNVLIDVHHFNPVIGGGNMSTTLSTGLTGGRLLRMYATGNSYPFEPATSAIFSTTGVVPKIRFYSAAPAAQDLNIESVSFGPSPGNPAINPGVGSNTVNVTVVNFGTGAITSQFGLSFSSDGGTTWSPTQLVTGSGLGSRLDTQTVTLTAPWTIPAVGAAELRVRIDPQIAGDPDQTDLGVYSFVPDADILAIGTTGPNGELQLGQNTITATIENNGNFSLEGVTIPMQYSSDGGASWLLATPHPFVGGAVLAATGGQQTFQFPGTVYFGSGAGSLSVRISPSLPGDPDLIDEASMAQLVGVNIFEILATSPTGTSVTAGLPFLLNTYTATRSTAIYYASELAAAGLNPGDPIVGMSLMTGTSTTAITADYQNFRVGMMHTTDTTVSSTQLLPLTSDFQSVFGPQTYTPAELSPSTYIDMAFHTPFIWNGVDNVRFDFQHYSPVIGGGSRGVTTITGLTGDRITRSYLNGGTYPYEPLVANVFTSASIVPKIRLMAPVPVPQDLDIDSVRFGAAVAGAVDNPSVGSNVLHVTVKNAGMNAITSQFGLSYSSDAGATWTPTQMVTASGLNSRHDQQTVTLTAPWTIGSIGQQNFRVRIDPQIASDPDLVDELAVSFTPNLDVEVVTLFPMHRLNTPTTINARVANRGNFDISGANVGLRYRIDQGAWENQSFTLGAMAASGDSQVLSFTTPASFATAGNYEVEVEIYQQVAGDPDATDVASLALKGFGETAFDLGLLDLPGTSLVAQSVPLSSATTYSMFTMWTPEQLRYWSGDLTEFGFQYSTAGVSKTWPFIEITFGETTLNWPNTALTFAQMFDAGAPATVVHSGPMTVNTVAAEEFARIPLTTPYNYSGQNNLAMLIRVDPNSATPASSVRIYSGGGNPNFRQYATGGTAVSGGTTNLFYTHGASFAFQHNYDPGMRVKRSSQRIFAAQGDSLGITMTAGAQNTLSYDLENVGGTTNLSISSITVTNQTNVVASVSGTAPTSVPVGTTTVPLNFTVNPSAGNYSFDVTIVSNTAEPGGSPFTWTVSGTGFVNSAPSLSVFGSGAMQVSGTHPNFLLETIMGDALASEFRAADPDGHQLLTVTVTEVTGAGAGSITAAAAGFTNSFPLVTTPGAAPRSAMMLGTAAVSGTVVFQVSVSDNGVFPLGDAITVTYRIGARVDVTSVVSDSLFVRVGGVKDFYRGQTGRPVDLLIDNPNPFAVHLQSTNFMATAAIGGATISGITVTLSGAPVTIPANATGHPVVAVMDIDSNASGSNGQTVELVLASAIAIDPSDPVGNPIVVKIDATVDLFNLYDGPVPQPMMITTTAFNPAVETVSFLQDLLVTGGLGTYTWSIAAGSASGLPTGLSLNPNGNEFLPASVQGTPAAGSAAASPYVITLQVSDGAYLATATLTMNVSILTPLAFAPVTLPAGQEFVAYPGLTLQAAGGSQIYNFTVEFSSPNTLPAGLVLNAQTGEISGIPADQTQGTYSIIFEVSDGLSTATQSSQLVISAHPLTLQTTTLSAGEATVAYSEFLVAIGGTGARVFSIDPASASQLPTGLTLNQITGEISGTPAVNSAGSYNITFRVTDGQNANTNQAITLQITNPAALAISTTELGYAVVGTPLVQSIESVGGSRNYSYTLGAGPVGRPASLAISTQGELSVTPVMGNEGRYPITIIVNDGFNTSSVMLALTVLAYGADQVRLSEVDLATGYLEFTNLGFEPVDVSGWSLVTWVDGVAPTSLAFDTLPGATLSLPTEVTTLSLGGTAGGTWPSYAAGSTWSATANSDLAVALFDRYGNLVDFVQIGTVNVSGLLDGSSSPANLSAIKTGAAALISGSNNHSLTTAGWVGSATGSQFAYNPGLAAFPLTIVNEDLTTGLEGAAYSHPVLAIGGNAPYTWSLTAPNHPWLSINPTTGELSGTPGTGTAGAAVVTIMVTDAAMATASVQEPLPIAAGSDPVTATFTVGQGTGQSFAGTIVTVPVTLTTAATDVSGFSFIISLPTTTSTHLAIHRVIAGPATLAAGRSVVARGIGGGRYFVGDMDGPGQTQPVGAGVVAIIEFIVPAGGPDAPQGTYAVEITNPDVSRAAIGVFRTSGANGELVLSNYSPADVNRDGLVNVVDVQRCVNLILSTATPSYPGEGDANGDGMVNVVDVQTIVNCILTAVCPQ
jgi:hypothetical protein